jgi:two-component system sensor histidine kinase BaeS
VIIANYLSTLDYKKIAIEVDNRVVGYFAVSKRNQLTQGYEVEFIEQQQEYLWLIALLVISLF